MLGGNVRLSHGDKRDTGLQYSEALCLESIGVRACVLTLWWRTAVRSVCGHEEQMFSLGYG